MKRVEPFLIAFVILLSLSSCQPHQEKSDIKLLNATDFTQTVDGKQTGLYTLTSGNGITMQITNYGSRIVSLWAPDREGKYEDIVLGYENIDRYIHNEGERFLGPVVGRYANRIAKGQFTLDGVKYQLPTNSNGQCLHGGLKGLDRVVWNVDSVSDREIRFSYTSPDGEDGFPGTLAIKMSYTLTPDNELKISYSATTDKATVINLSHHAVFNLKGEGNGGISDNILTINGSHIVPVDENLIPTGEISEVDGTPFDFRQPVAIGSRIDQDNEQLQNGKGYDHNWVIDRKTQKQVEHNATLYEPASGRIMEVWSDQPGMQFYSGNFFDGKVMGKYGKAQNFRESVALETQHFPDSPNHENFPSTRLNPGETYTQTCIYKFSVKQ